MGHGAYSTVNATTRAITHNYATASSAELFQQRQINNAMNPHGIRVRESRDSVEHPNSLAIILALDVTGSMGSVPHWLVKEGLLSVMEKIVKSEEKDPQILFLGIGDHTCDDSPLQVGQFESSDELLDKWLRDIYLEGGGGGNIGESYMLAWYFAAFHTSMDCFEKRKRKGLLFTVGDEPVIPNISAHSLKTIMGPGQYQDFSAVELIDKAREKYDVYHFHICETSAGSRQEAKDMWKQLLADNVIFAERKENIASLIVDIVNRHQIVRGKKVDAEVKETKGEAKEEMML